MAEILVLDDVLDAAVLIEKILAKKGHKVHTFTEEEEALAFAGSAAVELAVLDIKLQKMSGVQVLARLKEIHPEMHAIMLTGFPTVETAREAISLGADEYCVKPIDRQELEDKVERALKGKNRKGALNI
ncbi:MAG: response regulator [Desulfocapsaceae bacterium]|nr:response regulator [Desulfocapsaceae bacterium]